MKIKILLNKIWPSPPSDETLNPPHLFQVYIKSIEELRKLDKIEYTKILDECSKEIFDQTIDRRNNIEKRSETIILINGISLTLLGGLFSLVGQQLSSLNSWYLWFTIGLMSLSLIYQFGALRIALSVYVGIPRTTLDPSDLIPRNKKSPSLYTLNISLKRLEYSIYNYRSNNHAMGYTLTAQNRLKSGLLLLLVSAWIVLFTYGLIRYKTSKTPLPISLLMRKTKPFHPTVCHSAPCPLGARTKQSTVVSPINSRLN